MDLDIQSFKNIIHNAEHHGNTNANTYAIKNSSGALGKYQFLESVWADDIKKFALDNGYVYNDTSDFLNNSTLQEDYFEFYIDNHLKPQAAVIKELDDSLSTEQIYAGLHFIGYPKLKKTVENKDFDRNQSFTTSLNDYFEKAGLNRLQSNMQPIEIDNQKEHEFIKLDNDLNIPTIEEAKIDNTYIDIKTIEESLPEKNNEQDDGFVDVLSSFFNDFL